MSSVFVKAATQKTKITSARGIKGGPDAISAALVPGRILREDPLSNIVTFASSGGFLSDGERPGKAMLAAAFIVGDRGPI